MKFHDYQAPVTCYTCCVAPRKQRPTDDQPSLPYLVHRIASRLEHQINRAAKADGLKIEGIRILLRLLRGGDQRVGQLANATSIEQSALSHMLKRMEANGLVTRGKAVHRDSRTALVSLTLRGRRMAQKYAPLFKATDEAWMDGLALPDRRRLKQMLNDIYERISVDLVETEDDAHAAQ
jgi:DNA-binding MarR family transcriptional regulator